MLNLIKKEKGFTLIELMIVVAIIGILAAIAIPQFSSYRIKAFNSAAQTDLRNMMTSEEATYADTQSYAATSTGKGPGQITALPGAKISSNVTYSVQSITSGSAYTIYTGHTKGNKYYAGNETGLIQSKTIAAAPATALDATALTTALVSSWGTTL